MRGVDQCWHSVMVAQCLRSRLQGHAFEARVYAESPAKGFMPSPGTIASWRAPLGSVAFSHMGDVRVDSGVQQGDQVLPCSGAVLRQTMTHLHMLHVQGSITVHQAVGGDVCAQRGACVYLNSRRLGPVNAAHL